MPNSFRCISLVNDDRGALKLLQPFRTVLSIFSFTKSSPTAGILDAQIHFADIPEPYQAGDCPHRTVMLPTARDRGWPMTTMLWHPHFNVERTNPEWK